MEVVIEPNNIINHFISCMEVVTEPNKVFPAGMTRSRCVKVHISESSYRRIGKSQMAIARIDNQRKLACATTLTYFLLCHGVMITNYECYKSTRLL